MTEFAKTVYFVVTQIPKGETRTYKEVAEAAGRPGAYRAVGTILSKNQDPAVPCHRVVKSDGSLGGYNGLQGEKQRLLELESRS